VLSQLLNFNKFNFQAQERLVSAYGDCAFANKQQRSEQSAA
jgi:hypothetical protein